MSGASLDLKKKSEKKCSPVGLCLRWQEQFVRKEMQCRGVGGLPGDLPSVTGRSKELLRPQNLSSSSCTREKGRDVIGAEEVLDGVGVEGEGMGDAGG